MIKPVITISNDLINSELHFWSHIGCWNNHAMSKGFICLSAASKIGNYRIYALEKCFSFYIMQKNYLESLLKYRVQSWGWRISIVNILPGDIAASLWTTLRVALSYRPVCRTFTHKPQYPMVCKKRQHGRCTWVPEH